MRLVIYGLSHMSHHSNITCTWATVLVENRMEEKNKRCLTHCPLSHVLHAPFGWLLYSCSDSSIPAPIRLFLSDSVWLILFLFLSPSRLPI